MISELQDEVANKHHSFSKILVILSFIYVLFGVIDFCNST